MKDINGKKYVEMVAEHKGRGVSVLVQEGYPEIVSAIQAMPALLDACGHALEQLNKMVTNRFDDEEDEEMDNDIRIYSICDSLEMAIMEVKEEPEK